MWIYIVLLACILLLAGISEVNKLRIISLSSDKLNAGNYKERYSISYNIAMLIIIFFSGLRYDVGWDYMAYYETIAFGRITNIVLNKEWLTILLINISKNLEIPQIYFFINAFFTNLLISLTIKKYSKDKWISLMLFVTFPLFYLNSLSVIRNFMAIAIAFYSYKYIKEKKVLKYILSIIIATLFHKSAIVALLFYFVKNIKLKRYLYFIMLAVAPLLSNVFNMFILRFLPRYAVYTVATTSQQGTKAIIVFLFIGIVAIIVKDKIIKSSKSANYYFNFFIIGLIIYLVFYKQGTLGHRLSIYGTIYSLILIPDIICLYDKGIRVIIKSIFYLLCITMFFYMLKVGHSAYVPYTIFLK